MTGLTKVSDLDIVISVNDYVVRLKVTVSVALTMDVLSPFNKLCEVKLTGGLIERMVFVHQLGETAAAYKLHDYDSRLPIRYFCSLNKFYCRHDFVVMELGLDIEFSPY